MSVIIKAGEALSDALRCAIGYTGLKLVHIGVTAWDIQISTSDDTVYSENIFSLEVAQAEASRLRKLFPDNSVDVNPSSFQGQGLEKDLTEETVRWIFTNRKTNRHYPTEDHVWLQKLRALFEIPAFSNAALPYVETEAVSSVKMKLADF